MARDGVERVAGVGEGSGLKLEEGFAAAPDVADKPRALENAEMLGDRLPREGRVFCETGD